MRKATVLLTAALVAAPLVALAGPAGADDPRGCSGAYGGPVTCSFELRPGDRGIRLTVHAAPGTFVAARARCCYLLGPDGERLTHPVTGEQMPYAEVRCGVGGPNGGTCSSTAEAPPRVDAVRVYDDAVDCELVSLDGGPISGTWTCEPV